MSDSSLDKDILEDFPLAESHEEQSLTNNLVEDFKRFREAPIDSLKTLLKHVTGSSWRSYDDYIGQQLYTPGITEFFKQQTLANPALQDKINELARIQLDLELPIPSESESNSNSSSKSIKSQERAAKKLLKAREERYSELQQWLNDMSNRIVDEMTSSFDHKTVLRFMYYMVAQIFSRTYHQGVHVNMAQIQQLRKKAQELQQKRQSLIFLPCHKSHIDYMSIQFICFRVGISLPTVVAGNNLNFAVIGPMLRQVGALWIRRSFGNDKLYNATMQAFVEMLLSNGYNFECFIEGTRSRSGKLLPPKFGMLKFIVEAILSGRVEDTWIVPVSTQYDKVAEAESYATELLGKEKQKENFSGFLNARKIMSLQMGRVDVRFHEPWSLREFVTSQISRELSRSAIASERFLNHTSFTLNNNTHNSRTGGIVLDASNPQLLTAIAKDPSLLTPEIKIRLLRALGYRVLGDINAVSVIMPTSLIGTMLLTNRGRGISKENLERRVRWLIAQVKKHGGQIGEFPQPSIEHLVDNGLQVLGSDLVGEESRGLLQTTYYAKDPFKLSYYRNQIIHLFVPEAIVAVAIYSRVLNMPNSEDYITFSDLLGRVTFLSRLLSGEFVFGPEGIQTNLMHTLQTLADQNVLVMEEEEKNVNEPHHNHNETIIRISPREVAQGRENFDFFCFFVWPFVDGFWLTLVALFALTPTAEHLREYYEERGYDENNPRLAPPQTSTLAKEDVPLLWLEERTFLNAAQMLGKTLYHQGIVTYYEAVNKEMLKNALLQYVAEGIVIQRKADKRPTLYALHPAWLPTRYYPDNDDYEDNSNNSGSGGLSAGATDAKLNSNSSRSVKSKKQKYHKKHTVATYVDLDDDPDMVHVLRPGDIIPEGKLYDFEESVAHTRRLIRLRRDSPSLSVPVLRLVSSILDGHGSTNVQPSSIFHPSSSSSSSSSSIFGKRRTSSSSLSSISKTDIKVPSHYDYNGTSNNNNNFTKDNNNKNENKNILGFKSGPPATDATIFINNIIMLKHGGGNNKSSSSSSSSQGVLIIQSLNEASRPETDNTRVIVSKPSKVAYTAKL